MSTIVSSSTATGSSGTLYVSGLSGLDTSALIEAAVEAKMQRAYVLDTKIEELDAEAAAYSEMRTLLNTMSDALESLSSETDESAFETLTSYLTSTLNDPTGYLGVTVTDEADVGVYEIDVTQIATRSKVASGELATDDTVGIDGTFTLSSGAYTAAEITIASDMTLSDVASAINAVSDETGVNATLIATSDGNKTLVLSSTDTGASSALTVVDDGVGILAALGFDLDTATGAFQGDSVIQEGKDAILTVDGVQVTSASNDIEDLMPGVSVNLYEATNGGSISLEVDQDLSEVLLAIESFVEAYNAYRDFALTNQEVESGAGAAEDAVLFGESTLKSANTALYAALATSVTVTDDETGEDTVYSLASLGIELDDDNSLTIDEDALEEALLQRPNIVQALFSTETQSSSTDLGISSVPASMSGTYTMDVETDAGGNVTAASIDGVALAVSGTTLKGVDGTAFEGLYLYYTGDAGAAGLAITITPGLADQVVGMVDTYTNYSDGLITEKLTSLDSMIESKEEKRDLIAERAEAYEERLVKHYADLETKITLAENQLTYIETLLNTNSD